MSEPMSEHGRIEQFKSEIEELNLRTANPGLEHVLQILGAVLMGAGIVLAAIAYFVAGGQNSGDLAIDNLEHNEHMILAVTGLGLTVVGAAVFLRYSLGRFFRVWLLRQIYESRMLADQLDRSEPRGF